tara:strand:+ start:4895 stop:5479 length:585 start_codon:yes stop_codon:yes gene_type:complete
MILTLKPLPFEPSPPVLGQAVPFIVEGEGRGILYGPPWLKVLEKKHRISSKRFSKAVVFRKTPVSILRPDLPVLRRRPRLVKAGDKVWIIANKPSTRIRLKSLNDFKEFTLTINPKGIIASAPSVKSSIPEIHSEVPYKAKTKSVHSRLKAPTLISQKVETQNLDLVKILTPKLSLVKNELNSQEIYKLSQQKK